MSDASGARLQRAPQVPEPIFVARVVASTAAVAAAFSWKLDPDLWGHLRFGLDALRDRSLPSVDPYSFTSDIAWINHEWLSETLMGIAYLAGGVAGLLLLKAAVIGGAYLTLARRLRHVEAPARWWLQAVAIAASWPITSNLRPQLWTLLALALLTATAHWPLRRQFLWWPLLFALWANLHGGWIVGLGVLGAGGAGTIVDRRQPRLVLPLAGLCAACLGATLLTPYGISLWTFLWRTVGFGRDIVDWRPVWEMGVGVTALWMLVAVTGAVVAWRTEWSWAAMLPVLLLAVASLKVVRLVGLFGIVVALLAGARWRRGAAPEFRPALVALLSVVALAPAVFGAVAHTSCVPITGAWAPDLQAAGALASSTVSGRLMVPFNWGQYAIWHFAPRLRVSMDGRRETVYSEARLEQQLALDTGERGIVPFIRAERPEYVWLYLPEGRDLATQLRGLGYRSDVTTGRSMVLTRADLPQLAAGVSAPACFP